MTRGQFLAAYRSFARRDGVSSRDTGLFVEEIKQAMNECDPFTVSAGMQRAWTAIGGEGRVTLGKLRQLEE